MKIEKLLLVALMALALQACVENVKNPAPGQKALAAEQLSTAATAWPDCSKWPVTSIDKKEYFTSTIRADNADTKLATAMVLEMSFLGQNAVLVNFWQKKLSAWDKRPDMMKLLVNGKWVDVKPETMQLSATKSVMSGEAEMVLTAEPLNGGPLVKLTVARGRF